MLLLLRSAVYSHSVQDPSCVAVEYEGKQLSSSFFSWGLSTIIWLEKFLLENCFVLIDNNLDMAKSANSLSPCSFVGFYNCIAMDSDSAILILSTLLSRPMGTLKERAFFTFGSPLSKCKMINQI